MVRSFTCSVRCLYIHFLRSSYTASFHIFVIATVVHGNDRQQTRGTHGLEYDPVKLAVNVRAGDCVQVELGRQIEEVSS